MKKNIIIPKEVNAAIDMYLANNEVKNMADIEKMMSSFFGPAIQKILDAEMDVKLKYDNENIEAEERKNYRNGYHKERNINSSYGEYPVSVPRDRNGNIESDLIPKYSRNISGFEDRIISLYASGMTLSEIREHVKELFGCNLTDDMISDITDKILPEAREWQKRKLDKVYPIVFIDATHFSTRTNGMVVKKAVYVLLAINKEGKKEVIGIYVGENESAKVWAGILNDLKNRGVEDILIICSDGLTGITEAIAATYPNADYQRCIVHQIRNSMKFVPYKDRKELANDLKCIYTAPNEELGYQELIRLDEKWSKKYPTAIKSWVDNWDKLNTFFKFPPELRKIMYTTNAIESLNSRYKALNKKRTVFPTDDALLKVIYLNTMKISKKWTFTCENWDLITNQLKIMYDNRI